MGDTTMTEPTMILGYHKIRGLAAPCRMVCHYGQLPHLGENYGDDMKETWFGGKKPELAMINLPYIVDGDLVITQSNTCLLYLGQKAGIDKPEHFINNHMVLDQCMDLRNDLMKIVYPFGSVKTKEEFPEAAKSHLEKSKGHFTKLNAFCKGPYMCGADIQSGDFHVFEMIDQHMSIAAAVGVANYFAEFPALVALHAAVKADPKLAGYFEHDTYAKYAHNNGLFTHHTGHGEDFVYGPTEIVSVTF